MKQNLRVSLGAVVLALAALAAVIFAFLNFQQRSKFELVDDGVAWLDTDHGIEAWRVAKGSPAALAGIRPGDHLGEIDGVKVGRAVKFQWRLTRAGLGPEGAHKLSRGAW